MTELRRDLRMYLPVYLVVIAVYVAASFLSDDFFTWPNNVNLFGRVAPLVLAGLAQTLVVLGGGLDLSIGSMISVTNVIAASLPYVGSPANLVLWAIVPPLAGMALGCINGLLIAPGRYPPFIVTLATSTSFLGLALLIMDQPGGQVADAVTFVESGTLLQVPVPLIIIVATVAAGHIFLSRTRTGRSIYAMGGNEILAVQSGIRTARVRFITYALSGLLSGLAGAYMSARMFSGDPLIGDPYVMNSIAVAVIGGTSLVGGSGGALGLVGGAYIFYLIDNILNLMSINAFYQYIAKGGVLIVALAISTPDLLRRLKRNA